VPQWPVSKEVCCSRCESCQRRIASRAFCEEVGEDEQALLCGFASRMVI
jgi:hypothetical protein